MKKLILIVLMLITCLSITGCKDNNNQNKANSTDDTNIKDTINDTNNKTETITITFDSDGGSKIEKQKISKGKKVTIPKEPTKEGYVFLGWYNNGILFDFSIPLEKDLQLKAKWEKDQEKTYTVTFDSNGGTSVEKQLVKENEKAKRPNPPVKSGHTFVYWELDNKQYNFNSEVKKDITLKAKWKKNESQETPSVTKYKIDAFFMPNCYTEESVLSNKQFEKVTNVSVGDRIVCFASFETYAADPVKSFKYTLTYGSGLKLIKADGVSSATKNGNTYEFTLKKPSSVEDIGDFTFEVVGTTDLTYGIKDIQFTTKDNKKYYSNDNINSLKNKWDASYTKYKIEAFGMSYCYTQESVLANNFKVAETVNVGDKIVCIASFETYANDNIKSFKYTLTYGSGLKLIKADRVSSATKNGNTYEFSLKEPTGVEEIGDFTFEVVNTSDLTYGIKDIKFITTDNKYYYDNDITRSLKTKWDGTYSKYQSDPFSMNYCYTEESVIENKQFEIAKNVKVGDKVVCFVNYETNAKDKVKTFKYTLTYGSGLKLIKEADISLAKKYGNTYDFTLTNPNSYGEVGTFTFQVINTNNLSYGLKDIKFITTDNKFYYTGDEMHSLT